MFAFSFRRSIATATAVFALSISPVGAQDIDDALKGFGDDKPASRPAGKPKPNSGPGSALPGWIVLGGGVSQDAIYNYAHDAPSPGQTDHRGLSGLRSRLDIEADITFSPAWRARVTGYGFFDSAFRVQGRDGYTAAYLDENESEVEIGEAFVLGKLRRNFDIRVGRQIVVWGKSDSIRVTDILNPLDMRSPGRTDIADLRLPVAMTKLDYYLGDWNASVIVVHEQRFSKLPVPGSDFFPGATPLPPHDPEAGFGDQEFAVALNGTFRGWDMSLYGAYFYDERAYSAMASGASVRRHGRLWMGGVTANIALGSWLLKGEAALFDGLRFASVPGTEFSRLDTMAGVEYSGIADTSIALEAAIRHLLNFDGRISTAPDYGNEDGAETALRISRKFLNDTLEVGLVMSTYWLKDGNGGFQRLQLTYDLTDSVEVSGGVINFDAANTPRFATIGNNDRVYAKVKYRF